MENSASAPAVAVPANTCAACFVNVSTDDAFCNNCGYPLQGSEEEQKNFITKLSLTEIDLVDYQDKIKKGRNTLYILGVLLFVGTIAEVLIAPDKTDAAFIAGFGAVIMGIFFILGAWSKKKPFAAIVTGMCLWVALLLLNAIDDPSTLLKGIFLKIFIGAFFVNGIRAAIAVERIKKETHL